MEPSGMTKIYEGLANDFSYPNPKAIMIFPDNHDMDRIYTQFNKDLVSTKMALSYILTLPRIPQIYYGTEILMDNSDKRGDHGLIRTDFPGGWEGDNTNAFTGAGLTIEQKEMQSYLKTLLNYRKTSSAIHNGKTIHFAPENGIYVLFRITDKEIVAHIINKNELPITLDLNRFEEIGLDGKKVKNVISGEEFIWNDKMELLSKGSILLTTKMN
jgi:glycosidase